MKTALAIIILSIIAFSTCFVLGNGVETVKAYTENRTNIMESIK